MKHLVCCLLLFGQLALSWPLLAAVIPTSGQYHETRQDLSVKVMGGVVVLERTWVNGRWHFNRRWNPLLITRDPIDNSVISIQRGENTYEGAANNANVFVFARRWTISVNAEGFRWEDRKGNWIQYDPDGYPQAYGDRNNVKVSLRHDAENRLSGVFDHFERQILWFEYTDGLLTSVRDHSDRRVEYRYDGGQLRTVVDVRGFEWRYGYSGDQLGSITDPLGRRTELSVSGSGYLLKVEDSLGVIREHDYEYQKADDLFYFKTTDATGRVEEKWYKRDGQLVREDVNGKTIRAIQEDGDDQTFSDQNGYEVFYDFDEWGNILKVVYPDGSSKSYEYDRLFSRVTRYTNENGVVNTYAYDDRGNLIRKTEAVGTSVERTHEYEYDQYGNRTVQRTLGDNHTATATFSFSYDEFANITTMTDPEGNTTTYTHDVMGNIITMVNPLGHSWVYDYDAAGNRLKETNPLGASTTYTFDGIGNNTRIVSPLGLVITLSYDARDRLIARERIAGSPYRYVYDGAGRLLREVDEEGHQVFALTYNDDGLLVSSTDSNGERTTYEYQDSVTGISGLPVRINYPDFQMILRYDRRGRVTVRTWEISDTLRYEERYSYDRVGNRLGVTDFADRTTRSEFDPLNRLARKIDALGGQTTFTYDNRDNLIAVTDANQHTFRFEVDRNNQKTREVLPRGNWVSFFYDGAGNLTERTDSQGNRDTLNFDAANRLLYANSYYRNSSDSGTITTFSYDPAGNVTAYNDGTTTSSIDYDQLGRKIGETVNYGGFSLSYQYRYLDNDLKEALIFPDGTEILYTYNQNNQLTSMTPPGIDPISFAQHNRGIPEEITFPGGTSRTADHDYFNRLTSLEISHNNNPISSVGFSYDTAGNLSEKTIDNRNYVYGYDDLNRLISSQTPDHPSETFAYDGVGNRINDGTSQQAWEYSDNNELLRYRDIRITYDENSNPLEKFLNNSLHRKYFFGRNGYLYRIEDGNGNAIARYHYDPFGRRLWKEINGVFTYFLYSDEGLIGEFDQNGDMQVSYGYIADSIWTMNPIFMEQSQNYYFYHTDQIGTPFLLTDRNGDVVWEFSYQGFGAGTSLTTTVDNNLRFPGQHYDEESGLLYNYQRYYDPSTGRYISPDLMGLKGGINVYLYAQANPITNFDPLGLDTWVGASASGSGFHGVFGAKAEIQALYNPKTGESCLVATGCLNVGYGFGASGSVGAVVIADGPHCVSGMENVSLCANATAVGQSASTCVDNTGTVSYTLNGITLDSNLNVSANVPIPKLSMGSETSISAGVCTTKALSCSNTPCECLDESDPCYCPPAPTI